VADTFGPRWALSVGAASGVAAAIVVSIHLMKQRHAGDRTSPPRPMTPRNAQRVHLDETSS
jgi:hypothetical protein